MGVYRPILQLNPELISDQKCRFRHPFSDLDEVTKRNIHVYKDRNYIIITEIRTPTRRHRIRILPFLSYPFGLNRRILVHTLLWFPRKLLPIPDQNGQSIYRFSDQIGAQTIPSFGATHTFMVYIREYSPRAVTWFRPLLSVHTKKP